MLFVIALQIWVRKFTSANIFYHSSGKRSQRRTLFLPYYFDTHKKQDL